MILCIKADSHDVFLGLFKDTLLAEKSWNAGRELSVQIHQEIETILESAGIELSDITGIIVYEGPGSYTGLRISISVANTIGYAQDIPVVGSTGGGWIEQGLANFRTLSTFSPVKPVYGGGVFTTKPRK